MTQLSRCHLRIRRNFSFLLYVKPKLMRTFLRFHNCFYTQHFDFWLFSSIINWQRNQKNIFHEMSEEYCECRRRRRRHDGRLTSWMCTAKQIWSCFRKLKQLFHQNYGIMGFYPNKQSNLRRKKTGKRMRTESLKNKQKPKVLRVLINSAMNHSIKKNNYIPSDFILATTVNDTTKSRLIFNIFFFFLFFLSLFCKHWFWQ